jgi:hypothetical protein
LVHVVNEKGRLTLEIGQMNLDGNVAIAATRKTKACARCKVVTEKAVRNIGGLCLGRSSSGITEFVPPACRAYENEWITLRYQEMYGFQY